MPLRSALRHPLWTTLLTFLLLMICRCPPAIGGTELPQNLAVDGWEEIMRRDGIISERQPLGANGQTAYRARGVLKAPITQILAVLADTQTAADWIPDLASQNLVEAPDAFENVTHSVYAVPFPFADRDMVLRNRLWLDHGQGDLVAEAISIDHPLVPIMKRRVRAHMACSRTRLQPLGDGATAIDFIMVVDPRGRLPAFLAAFGLRRAPFKFVKALEARAQTAGYPLPAAYRDLLDQLPTRRSDGAFHNTVKSIPEVVGPKS